VEIALALLAVAAYAIGWFFGFYWNETNRDGRDWITVEFGGGLSLAALFAAYVAVAAVIFYVTLS
jgi:hypothetical protein